MDFGVGTQGDVDCVMAEVIAFAKFYALANSMTGGKSVVVGR